MAALVNAIVNKTSEGLKVELHNIDIYLTSQVRKHIENPSDIFKQNSNEKDIIDKLATETVKLIDGKNKSEYLEKDEENLIELINQIRHIRVIIEALSILEKNKKSLGLSDKGLICHSTQTSKKEDCDLQNNEFALEAFGGIKYSNNRKLGKDLLSLYNKAKGKKQFLAFFKEADNKLQMDFESTDEEKKEQSVQCDNQKINFSMVDLKKHEGVVLLQVKISKVSPLKRTKAVKKNKPAKNIKKSKNT